VGALSTVALSTVALSTVVTTMSFADASESLSEIVLQKDAPQ
jgi:hypothetical protein